VGRFARPLLRADAMQLWGVEYSNDVATNVRLFGIGKTKVKAKNYDHCDVDESEGEEKGLNELGSFEPCAQYGIKGLRSASSRRRVAISSKAHAV
jgi:hypothetical protein